ncbi:MAG TPA: Shedu anti-phage system protein SduA domain-containing protein [Gemmata sp.]
MKRFESFVLNRAALRDELNAFRLLLTPEDKELSEQKDILPFFKSNRNLASLIGFAKSHLSTPDVIKSEFPFVGDHACDLAIGERREGAGQFCFIEFEDGREASIFRHTVKGTPDWAPRLEHGFSQIVDWFHVLADQSQTPLFREFFGTGLADYCGLLVIGRDRFLSDAERSRLRWRSQNMLVSGKPVSIITFDQLFQDLAGRVDYCAPEPVSAPFTRSHRSRAGQKSKREQVRNVSQFRYSTRGPHDFSGLRVSSRASVRRHRQNQARRD